MTEVDPADPAFDDPTKFVGPVYRKDEAHRLAAERGWVVKPDGDAWRRVVPSPVPLRIFERRPVEWLLGHGCVVVCAGGGGIPTMYRPGTRTLIGVEAVIDKDRASWVLARDLHADTLVIATDTDAVYVDWGHCAPAPDPGGPP
jgi:carbamate kinase